MVVAVIASVMAIGVNMRPSVRQGHDRRRGHGCESDDSLAAAGRAPGWPEGSLRANWAFADDDSLAGIEWVERVRGRTLRVSIRAVAVKVVCGLNRRHYD